MGMLKKTSFLFACSFLYATPNYFICSIAQSSAFSCFETKSTFKYLKTYTSSRYTPTTSNTKPIFVNIQTQLQHRSPHLLSYADIDSYSNIYAKNFKHLKILSSLTFNTLTKNYVFKDTLARFTLGAGMHINLRHTAGKGGFAYYQDTTLSLESRFHFATSLILKQQHLLELSLQFPVYIAGLFGYDPTRGDNFLFSIRFVYGGKEYQKIQSDSSDKAEDSPTPTPLKV